MSLLLRARTSGRVLLCTGLSAAVIALTGCAGEARNNAQAYDSDTAIAERVHQAMSRNAANAAALQDGRIRIRVLHGSVTLSGNTHTAAEMSDALAAVRSVGGVQAVQSDLHLQPTAPTSARPSPSISKSAKTDFPNPSRSE